MADHHGAQRTAAPSEAVSWRLHRALARVVGPGRLTASRNHGMRFVHRLAHSIDSGVAIVPEVTFATAQQCEGRGGPALETLPKPTPRDAIAPTDDQRVRVARAAPSRLRASKRRTLEGSCSILRAGPLHLTSNHSFPWRLILKLGCEPPAPPWRRRWGRRPGRWCCSVAAPPVRRAGHPAARASTSRPAAPAGSTRATCPARGRR